MFGPIGHIWSPRTIIKFMYKFSHYHIDNVIDNWVDWTTLTWGSATCRGEAIDGVERRNESRQFLDTLVMHDASLQQNSNQNFRENIEPILLLYHSRARLSNRRVGARNPLHEEGEHYRNRNLNIEERRRRFRSQVGWVSFLMYSFCC